MNGPFPALSKDQFADLLNSSLDAKLFLNADERILYANGEAARLYGVSVPALLGSSFVAPELLLNDSSVGVLTLGDGSRRYAECFMLPLHGATEAVTFVSMHDVTDSFLVKQALADSEELHRLTVASISDAVFITDDNGTLTFICPNLEVIFSLTLDDIHPGENISRLLGDGFYDPGELKNNGEIENIEMGITDAKGRSHTLLVNVKAVSIKGGTRLITCRDVTDLRLKEAALGETESRYRWMAENSTDIIALVDREARFVYISPAVESTLGYTPEELIGRQATEIAHLDETPSMLNTAERVVDANARTLNRRRYYHKSGETVWLETASRRIEGLSEDQPFLLISVSRDISDRMALEAAQQYRIVLEQAIAAVARHFAAILPAQLEAGIDFALRVLGEASQSSSSFALFFAPDLSGVRAAQFWKAPEDDLTEDRLLAIHPRELPQLEAALSKGEPLLLSGSDWASLGQAERRFFEEYGISSLALVPIMRDGTLSGVLGFASDDQHTARKPEDLPVLQILAELIHNLLERRSAETNRRELEEQLIQAQKLEAIGALAGGIAHDFNNVLAAITGYGELVLEGLQDPGQVELQQEVLTAAHRAIDLVRQILSFSRQSKSQAGPVRTASIMREVLRMLRASLPATIEIRQKIEDNDAAVIADGTRIHQVLLNLCTNAGHAMGQSGGELFVGQRLLDITVPPPGATRELEPGRYLVLTVRDTGYGIAPENMARLFDLFFTTKEEGVGTGLGLPTVQKIVHELDGAITVESAVAVGTTFEIYLPSAEVKLAAGGGESSRAAGGTERILVVDDEATLVVMRKEGLRRLGYEVTAFFSSQDAWTAFAAAPDSVDLVVTDQTMPGMTGDELARRMLELRPALPIILCTGSAADVDEEQLLALGIARFLVKPVSHYDLARAIRQALDKERA